MSNPFVVAVRDDRPMNSNSSGPRAGGPTSRRSFTPAQKLDFLVAYDEAIGRSEGGEYVNLNEDHHDGLSRAHRLHIQRASAEFWWPSRAAR